MDGITILNTIQNPITKFQWNPLAIISTIIFLGLIIFFIIFAIKTNDEVIFIFTTMACIGLGLVITWTTGQTKVGQYSTYEVIVEDTVSMNEFTQKYEIIEQRGEIYVIKDKEIK